MRWLVAIFGSSAVAGLVASCLTTLAPGIRTQEGPHAGLGRDTADETCMACHEPERVAMQRLRELPPSARVAEMDRMMGEGGASLVAQWMIDDPQPCVRCHEPRGGRR